MPELNHIQRFITESNLKIESDMANPTFTWNGTTYPFISSVASFERELESGGFAQVQMMTATVRRFNIDGSAVFTTLPQAQQKIVYSVDGRTYRIISVRQDPTQSYFRITAECSFRGI